MTYPDIHAEVAALAAITHTPPHFVPHEGANLDAPALIGVQDQSGPAAVERPGPGTEEVTSMQDQSTPGERTNNSDRARRAADAAAAYDGDDLQWSVDDVDQAHQVIKDLLGDLRHLCDRVGVDFDAADRAASRVHEWEKSKDDVGEWALWLEPSA